MSDLRTPLHDWHLSQGGKMVPFAGWNMPVQYTGIIDEHRAVRTDAGMFDISHMARLVFEGCEAHDLIQHLWTNDAAALKIGQVRYGLLCDADGGILDDVLVYRFDRFWLMVVNASNRQKILDHIETERNDRDVTVTDCTANWAMIAVQGPRALEAVRDQLGDVSHLRYYTGTLDLPGAALPVVGVSRTGYTGEDGVEVVLPAEQAVSFADAMLAAGVKPCGLGARDTLRLEAGMPLYGHELGEGIDPFQANLGWAVKLDQSTFLGHDVLCRLKDDASRPCRVGLELKGKRAARG